MSVNKQTVSLANGSAKYCLGTHRENVQCGLDDDQMSSE